ncbi:VID27 cytoplasmic protein [Phanerochaete sordida]|uniref:VID27 cytoplasmic protein n=1 Tax=Phanerochaete sordida TaxID=48140 RepID=A0A9P3L7Q4_9APHY|nr:VID27 cytoplasmic protein [Phanerochaete sordida]
MNIFRNLFGKVWHDPNASEVVKISDGQLYLVRNEVIRCNRECIYNKAMMTIRRVPEMDHHFQLVVTREYEDGDEELLEEEEETDQERVFLISKELEFRTGKNHEDDFVFIWQDIDGDVGEFFEFAAARTNEPTRAFFETCMYRAMYERAYRRSADNTTDEDLAEFIYQPPVEQRQPKKGKGKAAGTKTTRAQPPASEEPSQVDSPSSSQATGAASEPSSSQASQSSTLPTPQFEVIAAVEAGLHLFDVDAYSFQYQHEVIAQIVRQVGGSPFQYSLCLWHEDNMVLLHRIDSDMNQKWAVTTHSLTWNSDAGSGRPTSWCIALNKEEEYAPFKQAFTRAMWESLHEESWAKAKADEQTYVMNAQEDEDVEMKDVEQESDEEEEVADELEKEEDQSEEEEEDELQDDEDEPRLPPGAKNSQLTVGYKGDRSYVVRGNNIGVFSHTGDQVKYYATISKIAAPRGNRSINPKQIMLHDQDTKMVVMDEAAPNSLFHLDIERGKIVEEWKVNDNIPVRHIAPDSKLAQMTPEQTLIGASGNALFRIDPRLSGDKLVDSQYKQYVSKNKFSSVATTEAGKIAVASEKGDIRLFDSIGKNAKTALPPLGDPIIGIDVTRDGRWVVATTRTYLLVIDTLIGDGKYTGQTGFDRSFPKDAKPIPRRLQLRTEHVAYMASPVAFTPARFNMGTDQEENTIVTSTGEYVVAWDFAKVKKGLLDKYEIKKYEDNVVQDNFKFGDAREIIVAMDNDVVAVNKKQLKRPTRASIATPTKNLRSSSNIVNAPY